MDVKIKGWRRESRVDVPHVIQIREHESLIRLETASDDISHVIQAELIILLQSDLFLGISLEEILFVI